MAMALKIWRSPTLGPPPSPCCSAMASALAMGPSRRPRTSMRAASLDSSPSPTTASTPYTGPITVAQTTTVKAIAQAPGLAPSGATSGTYPIQGQVAPPTFSPPAGTYGAPVSVTLSDAQSATIYYTTDGSTPTTASTLYTGAISVTQSMTINAMATASGMTNSTVASATYTIQGQVAPPTFSPPGGTYGTPVSVTLSDAQSATIYYTTDGSTPTTASTQYTAPITVTQNTTIRAMAAASGMANSSVVSATYTIQVATPTLFLPSGADLAPQSVTLSDATSGATIYYTTDGSTPTTGSTPYTGAAISVTQS